MYDFLYGIAKISQGLRKFRNHRENFAITARFRYAQLFAMIAKFRYHRENSLSLRKFSIKAKTTMHSENLNFRYASHFRYEIQISLS